MQPVWPFLAAINSACNHNAWLQASGEKGQLPELDYWCVYVGWADYWCVCVCVEIGRLLFGGGWAEVGGDDKHL